MCILISLRLDYGQISNKHHIRGEVRTALIRGRRKLKGGTYIDLSVKRCGTCLRASGH